MMSVHKKIFLSLAMVLGIVFLSFSPALKGDFLNWDDKQHILENPLVQILDFNRIRNIFCSAVNLTYIPLTMLSFSIEHRLFGFDPFFYHLDNILLHLIAVGLVFVFALRLGVSLRAATVAAVIFGIHPLRVESVVWITERKDVLYGVFYLMALLDYQKFVTDHQRAAFWRAVFWGLLSILSKPMALCLPLTLLLCDWFYGRRDFIRMVIEKAPFIAYAVFFASVTYYLNISITVADHGFFKVMLILVWTFTFYLIKFVVPFILVPNYIVPEPVNFFGPEYLSSFAVFVLVIWNVIAYRKNRWVVFAFGFYVLNIFPVLRVTDTIIKGAVADRYLYISGIGICILVGLLWDKFFSDSFNRRRIYQWIACAVFLMMIVLLGSKTYSQCQIWNNSLALWDYVIRHAPAQAFFYNNRGSAYLERREYKLALKDFNQALVMDPDFDQVYFNRGEIFKHYGLYDQAIANFSKAIAISPQFTDAYNNRGAVYRLTGQYDLALMDYDKAIALDPAHAKAYNNRGSIHFLKEMYDLALADFNKALALDPEIFSAYHNRAVVYWMKQKYDLAIADFTQSILLEPNDCLAYEERASVYGRLHQDELAIRDLDRVILMKPDNGRAYFNRSVCYRNIGQYHRAFQEAIHAAEHGYHPAPAYVNTLRALLRFENRKER